MDINKLIKGLLVGFWKNGFIELLKTILQNWIITSLVIAVIVYLCINPETDFWAWAMIAILAAYSAIKAIIEIIMGICLYQKQSDDDEKLKIVYKIGGCVFDFLFCIVGVFQALKILSHISRITKSVSSAASVVDDVASLISKILDLFTKKL